MYIKNLFNQDMYTINNLTFSGGVDSANPIKGKHLTNYVNVVNLQRELAITFFGCTFSQCDIPLYDDMGEFFFGLKVKNIIFENCLFTDMDFSLPSKSPWALTFNNCSFHRFVSLRFGKDKSSEVSKHPRDRSHLFLALYSCSFEHARWSNIQNYAFLMSNTYISTSEWIKKNGEKHPEGFVFYKDFGRYYKSPEHWVIKKGSVLVESVDPDRTNDCSYGINVCTLSNILDYRKTESYKFNYKLSNSYWKVLLKYEDMADAVWPYFCDKLRIGKCTLLEEIYDNG